MIYLIDTIGTETGMHLYDNAFRRAFEKEGVEVTILSNYKDTGTIPIIKNFYHGNIIRKIFLLMVSYFNMLIFYHKNKKNNIFIYQSFGLRIFDEYFIKLFNNYPNLYVIVHDIFDIKNDHDEDLKKAHKIEIYKKYIPNIISHSQRTITDLRAIGYQNKILFFPHFSYDFSKELDLNKVGPDIQQSLSSEKINFLFFGQIRMSKGIDILIDALSFIDERIRKQINVIIAGQDKTNIITSTNVPDFVNKICRYINDSELNYLFKNVDYILLPYKEIYQSGVLEAVIYFQKPAIMSNIGYFSDIKKAYPSFGITYEPNTGKDLAKIIQDTVVNHNVNTFYNEFDLKKYIDDHNPKQLINEILKNRN
ncbi:glycosyltransferase [uncultured Bacteroides sp.]|uniref:glycosyltransferase n=1 Tax=uncultured Bacteroides sp. TaxID=162156 RepID=UPI002634F6A9|nr:glycosyltransferase [uncultured Bacteroides sp.]